MDATKFIIQEEEALHGTKIKVVGVGGGGSVIVNVSAIDSQDVKRFFHSNGSLLVAALNKAVRNGSPLRTA